MLSRLLETLESAFEELPTEDEFIAEGYDSELDEYRTLSKGGKEKLTEICEIEKEKTGLNALKIKFNRNVGYFFEVPKRFSDSLPDYFIRRQTLTNADRFTTEELKVFEAKVLEAEQLKTSRQAKVFEDIRIQTLGHLESLRSLSKKIATLDIAQGFSTFAKKHNAVRPKLSEYKNEISIIQGRHPVVENVLKKGNDRFIPNDLTMDKVSTFHLVTGPNMAGKSTFLRQNAIILLLAHIGSYVPAKEASLPLVDQIFTRIGSGDSLSTGESTFLVEMQEASRILRHATKKSFIILDEIGRGTSTYDGLSLAWAITDYLHEKNAKTLFATHYHELIGFVQKLPNAHNFSVRVLEDKKRGIIFLHQIFEGGAEKSFGIEVAKLAGLPKEVVQKAEEVLHTLENLKESTSQNSQVSLFDAVENTTAKRDEIFTQAESEIEKTVKNIDINSLTPLQALQMLSDLKQAC